MRLRELLCACDFDDIVPHILRVYPEHASQIPWYREAYDILCHMKYKEYDGTISVEWVNCTDEEPYIQIGNSEGDLWESNLGKHLEIADNVHVSHVELAARCLWSITFYGYSPNDCGYWGHAPRNRYEEQAALLEHRQFANYARSANKCRKVLSESIAHDALTIEEWRVYARRERHRNHPKRMQDHRQNLRIKQLTRMGKVEYDIDRILRRTQQFTRAELNYLFDTKLITPATYHSRAYDRSRRLPNLLETLTRYGGVTEVDPITYTRVVVIISTDPEAPIEAHEIGCAAEIVKHIGGQSPAAEVLWAFGTEEGLGDEAELLVEWSY